MMDICAALLVGKVQMSAGMILKECNGLAWPIVKMYVVASTGL